jgi:hypothetical protein
MSCGASCLGRCEKPRHAEHYRCDSRWWTCLEHGDIKPRRNPVAKTAVAPKPALAAKAGRGGGTSSKTSSSKSLVTDRRAEDQPALATLTETTSSKSQPQPTLEEGQLRVWITAVSGFFLSSQEDWDWADWLVTVFVDDCRGHQQSEPACTCDISIWVAGSPEALRGIAVELNDIALGIGESERELELATEIERGDRRNCRRDAKRIRKACTDFEEANA